MTGSGSSLYAPSSLRPERSGGHWRAWGVVGLLVALGALIALAWALGVWSHPPGSSYPAVWWPLFPFGFFLFFLLVFVVFRFAWWGWGWGGGRYWARRYWAGDDGPSAQEILHRRYARGEISREQWQAMSRDLDDATAARGPR